jgi:hypothetical protein
MFQFIAGKTDAEKVRYIRRVLARSEEEAHDVIKPVFKLIRIGVEVFEVYRPIKQVAESANPVFRPGRREQIPRLEISRLAGIAKIFMFPSHFCVVGVWSANTRTEVPLDTAQVFS